MKQSKKGKSLGKSLSFKENNEDINKKTLTNRQVSFFNIKILIKGKKVLEKEFFEKSNGVFQLCKDRDIRFFTCLGDPYISEENRESILMRRDHYLVKFFSF